MILAVCAWSPIEGAPPEFPDELVQFETRGEEPIFVGAGTGHWDVKIRERGWILRDGAQYRMWYTGYDGTRTSIRRMGYATSPDGITWTRLADRPLVDDAWIEDMMIVRQGDTLYMFAEGKGDQSRLWTSTDGIQWNHKGELDVRRTSGEKIEPGPFGTPTGYWEAGTWYLFYERRDLGIWLATSTDTQVWTNVQDDPVLIPGPGKYDEKLIALNQIVKQEGRYFAYFHGSAGETSPALWTTNVAVSDDLIHWTKYAGNPLFPVEENKSSGIVVFDGIRNRLYTMHDKVFIHFAKKPTAHPDKSE